MRRTKVGTGITARAQVSYDPSDPDDFVLLQPELDGILSFMERIDAIEAEARGVLRRAGLSDQAPHRRGADMNRTRTSGTPFALSRLSASCAP